MCVYKQWQLKYYFQWGWQLSKKNNKKFSIYLEKIGPWYCPGSQDGLLAGTFPVGGVFIFSCLKGCFVCRTYLSRVGSIYGKLTSRTLSGGCSDWRAPYWQSFVHIKCHSFLASHYGKFIKTKMKNITSNFYGCLIEIILQILKKYRNCVLMRHEQYT